VTSWRLSSHRQSFDIYIHLAEGLYGDVPCSSASAQGWVLDMTPALAFDHIRSTSFSRANISSL